MKKVLKIGVLLIFVMILTTYAEVWDYPQPDPDRDVKDISFYQKPDDMSPLDNIDGRRPRNVIVLIGDGMGFNHVSLARYAALGPDGRLYMERMPFTGMMRTHTANRLVTDSAAVATALACGIKTNNGCIGMDADGTPYMTLLEKARDNGFRTGLVATATITHATPAGFAAHVTSRGMEVEIAAQMLDNRVDILFGGGRRRWLPEPHGDRKDERNLIDDARAAGYQVVFNREQLLTLTDGPALGLFANSAMNTFAPEPMLDEMTRVAIELLNKRSDAWFAPRPKFFMMVEGSQIDWAAHGHNTDNCIRQTLLFDMAVKEAIDFARTDKNTLVIVTADHETGGLMLRGSLAVPEANWNTGSHTAGDVPIYAFGPGAQRFSGTRDSTEIPVIIAELLGFDNFPAPLEVAQADQAEAIEVSAQ